MGPLGLLNCPGRSFGVRTFFVAPPILVFIGSRKITITLIFTTFQQVYGLASNSALIVKQNRDNLITPFATTNVLGACLVTWGPRDRHLRVRLKKNSTPEPILPIFNVDDDELKTVNIGTDATYLWLGFASGKIIAVRHTFKHRDLSLELHTDRSDGLVQLFAHREAVNDIASCIEFGVCISASEDATCVVWDLRKPSYVRTVEVEYPAKLVAVSRSSGDFAVVSETNRVDAEPTFSTLFLFTVNGNLVSSHRCEPPINAVTFSAAPEGVAVNVVATGHRTTGVIRLWNSWDLSPVRDIDTKLPQSPIVALAFSFDNQNLFAASSDGDVIIFEKSDVTGLQRPPKYLNLTEM